MTLLEYKAAVSSEITQVACDLQHSRGTKCNGNMNELEITQWISYILFFPTDESLMTGEKCRG